MSMIALSSPTLLIKLIWVVNASNNQYLFNLFYSLWSDGDLHHDSFVKHLCFFFDQIMVFPQCIRFLNPSHPLRLPPKSRVGKPRTRNLRGSSKYRSRQSQVPELQKPEIPSSAFCHGPELGIAAFPLKYRRCRGSFPELQNPESRVRGFVVAQARCFGLLSW